MASPLDGLLRLSEARTKRVSSFDRTGGNADRVAFGPGETFVMADLTGAGIVRHVWITTASPDPLSRRNMVLRVFVDGQGHPCVEAPLGDFFGQGWGMTYNFVSLPLACAPKDGHALVSYWPMPFGEGCRIEVENQGRDPVDAFYFYVDYEAWPGIGDDVPRFHAWFNHEVTTPHGGSENEWGVLGEEPKNTTDAHNYLLCDCEGRGHFVGVNYYVHSPGPVWYGEGDDMFLIDGEPWPGLHGTGTEDYFNMCWCPDEVYMHPYFGCARAPGRDNASGRFGWIGKTHLYRFHIEDPVRFERSLRASIEHGHANVLTLELASVAYWYQTLPTKPFPPLVSAEQRTPRPETGVAEVHRWRDAWRRERGSGRLWGNET